MPWVTRGLRDGILTTRYPARSDGYGPSFRGCITVLQAPPGAPAAEAAADGGSGAPLPVGAELEQLCPTGAISSEGTRTVVDQGRCVLCGRCVTARPDLFAFSPAVELAVTSRRALVVPTEDDDLSEAALAAVRSQLARRTKALHRSVHIRHVDAGSDGSEEWEVAALTNPVYDVQRLGVYFTASPRHADVLLVTGAGSAAMTGPVRRTWEAMPEPKVVVAAGTDAVGGGLYGATYATRGGAGSAVPVDVWVPGSPPSPFSLLHGVLLAVGLLPERPRR